MYLYLYIKKLIFVFNLYIKCNKFNNFKYLENIMKLQAENNYQYLY